MKRKISFLFLVTFLFSSFWVCEPVFAAASFDWLKIEPATKPLPPRSYIQTVYDPLKDKIILFGGCPSNDVGLNDLWEYDGYTWEQKFPANSPGTRYAYNMVYDSSRDVIVLFGGEDWPTLLGDTWEYDGNTWYRVNTANSPISRAHFALAYDSNRNIVVLFGGWHWYVDQGDTWEYDGTNWVQRAPANSPCVRQQVAMVYDENRGVVVLYGGTRQYANQGGPFDDTWEWDGNDWTKKQPQNNPGARHYHQMAYDSDNNKVILHGGGSPYGGLNDTWQYDGVDWTQIYTVNAPEVRSTCSFSYYPKKKSIVLFGGHIGGQGRSNDTWELVSLTTHLDAAIDIKPDTLNLKSKGKNVTAYIELPDGYNVEQIDVSTVAIAEINGIELSEPINAKLSPTGVGDYDLDGIPDLMVKFSREELVKLKGTVNFGSEAEISISGELFDSTTFSGSDSTRIIKKD